MSYSSPSISICVTLIVFLVLLLAESHSVSALFCPAMGSRQARAIIDKAFAQLDPPVDWNDLPSSCIFRKDNDLQTRAELLLQSSKDYNEVSGSNSWRCPICRADEPVDEPPVSQPVKRRSRK